MKDLQKLAKRAMEELDVIGVPYAYVEKFEVNTRAKSRWGQCKRRDEKYSININIELLDDNVADESALNTIIHELIHTCPNCMNHGCEWQKWAELVNTCYACYNIKRCTSAEEKGIDIQAHRERRRVEPKWTFECPSCDKEWTYKRRPQWLRNGYDPISKKVDSVKCPYCKGYIYMTKHGNLADVPHTYQF